MSSQGTLVPKKKKKRGPPKTGQGTPVMTRVHPGLLGRIDKWRSEQPGNQSRPEAIRNMVSSFLNDRAVLQTLPEELALAVEAWAAKQPDNPSVPEAIRRLVEKGLQAE